jgi:ABC-type transporter Mla subunit MlaD
VKKKLELQTVIVLLCALGVAASWIGIQVARDSFGKWSEAHELRFTTSDLLGLGPRSELRCAGAVIGHVRKVTPSAAANGQPQFTVIAGVGSEFSAWKFAPRGIVMFAVVQSALSPSWINLDIDTTPSGILALLPRDGPMPLLPLEREPAKAGFENIADRIDKAVAGFTEPQPGHTRAVTDELAEAVHHLDGVVASLDGQTRSTETDPAKRPPIDRLLLNLDVTAGNLNEITASLEKIVGPDGGLSHTLSTLDSTLVRLQGLTDEMSKTVNHLNLKVDTSLGKMNTLLEDSTTTVNSLQGKVDRLGGTFVGRMLIAKPDKKATPSPTPKASPRPSHD